MRAASLAFGAVDAIGSTQRRQRHTGAVTAGGARPGDGWEALPEASLRPRVAGEASFLVVRVQTKTLSDGA